MPHKLSLSTFSIAFALSACVPGSPVPNVRADNALPSLVRDSIVPLVDHHQHLTSPMSNRALAPPAQPAISTSPQSGDATARGASRERLRVSRGGSRPATFE